MSRAALYASLAVALLGAPAVVRADAAREGTCAVVHDHAFEVGLFDSVDPAELETADPETVAASPYAEGTGARLLCTDANDPRCSPLHTSDTPSSPDLPVRADAALLEVLSFPMMWVRPLVHGEARLLGPSAAPTSSTYRPPRS